MLSTQHAGDAADHRFTFQSSAKAMLLAALLQERGSAEVFEYVGAEPSGHGFASLSRLETHGPGETRLGVSADGRPRRAPVRFIDALALVHAPRPLDGARLQPEHGGAG